MTRDDYRFSANGLVLFRRLDTVPIEALELPVRAERALRNAGATTVADASRLTRRDIMMRPNVGQKSLHAIAAALAEFDVGLCA